MSENSGGSGNAVYVNIFSGAGLGILLGVIVGLSLTPVVSTVIGSLTSLLAVLLGLEGGKESRIAALGSVKLNAVRIGSFGLATVVGILLALYIRATEPFALPVEQAVENWVKADYPPDVARQLVMYERLGLTPEGMQANDKVTEQKQSARSHALFSADDETDLCFETSPSRWGDDPAKIMKNAYRDNPALQKTATRIAELPADWQLVVLTITHQMICDSEEIDNAVKE